MLGGLISEFYPSFIYNGESQISLIGNTVLAASLHFALSSCQPLFFFVALLMKERLVLRAVMTTWLVCGVGESCCGHWSAGGVADGRGMVTCSLARLLPTTDPRFSAPRSLPLCMAAATEQITVSRQLPSPCVNQKVMSLLKGGLYNAGLGRSRRHCRGTAKNKLDE